MIVLIWIVGTILCLRPAWIFWTTDRWVNWEGYTDDELSSILNRQTYLCHTAPWRPSDALRQAFRDGPGVKYAV